MGWNWTESGSERAHHPREGWTGTHKVVLVTNAFVEEELFDPERRSLQGVIDRPKCGTSSVADSGRTVTTNAVRLATVIVSGVFEKLDASNTYPRMYLNP